MSKLNYNFELGFITLVIGIAGLFACISYAVLTGPGVIKLAGFYVLLMIGTGGFRR